MYESWGKTALHLNYGIVGDSFSWCKIYLSFITAFTGRESLHWYVCVCVCELSDLLWRQEGESGSLQEQWLTAVSDVSLLDVSTCRCLRVEPAFNQQLDPVPPPSSKPLLRVHNAGWGLVWRQKSRADLAVSSRQRQLAPPLCSRASYFRDAVTSWSCDLVLSLRDSLALITHHWTSV